LIGLAKHSPPPPTTSRSPANPQWQLNNSYYVLSMYLFFELHLVNKSYNCHNIYTSTLKRNQSQTSCIGKPHSNARY
jgi:hypothetical protein